MTEETTTVTGQDEGTTQETTTEQGGGAQTTGDGTETTPATQTFTQADVDRIVKERLQRADAKAQTLAAKAKQEAEAAALAEQGKFKELYEKLKADNDAAQQRIKQMEIEALRTTVGGKVGLPEALFSRIQGDTEEAIEADAKALLAALPKPAAPNINSAGGGEKPNDAALIAAQANELAAIYGVNPKYLKTGV